MTSNEILLYFCFTLHVKQRLRIKIGEETGTDPQTFVLLSLKFFYTSFRIMFPTKCGKNARFELKIFEKPFLLRMSKLMAKKVNAAVNISPSQTFFFLI